MRTPKVEIDMPIHSPADLSGSCDGAPLRHELRIIENLDMFKAMQGEWDKIVAAAADYSLCLTYQYCELAAELLLAKNGIIAVATVHDDHELLALWPLGIQRKGGLRIARALTCGSNEEYGGALVKGAASSAVVAEALRAIMRAPADVVEFFMAQDGSLLQQALAQAPQSWLLPLLPKRMGRLPGYTIRLRGFSQWDNFTATLQPAFRTNLRRCLNRLNEQGHTAIGWCTTVEDAEAVLTWLFANKRHWAETRGIKTKFLMDEQVREFFIALARRTDLPTTPLVAFVKLDGVPVAASLNLVGRRTIEGFITTYDEAFSRYSVGTMLMNSMAKWAHANCLDFDLRPLHAHFKAVWANHITSHCTRTIFLSPRGRLMEISLLNQYGSRVRRKFWTVSVGAFTRIKASISRTLKPSRFKGSSA